jgi:hypothetical protein
MWMLHGDLWLKLLINKWKGNVHVNVTFLAMVGTVE